MYLGGKIKGLLAGQSCVLLSQECGDVSLIEDFRWGFLFVFEITACFHFGSKNYKLISFEIVNLGFISRAHTIADHYYFQ